MKPRLLSLMAGLWLSFSLQPAFAAETNDPTADLKALVGRIQTKLEAGKPTEATLAPELKEFDALVAKYQNDKSDEAANILFLQATLYSQVLDNEAKGNELLAKLKTNYPNSKPVQFLQRKAEAEKLQASLKPGATFPPFEVKALDGKPLSIANYKGKIVLLDFWATWCGPCVAELPNVLETYEKHHPDGFDIIGISLDDDRDKLTSFLQQKKMTWAQFFDGKGWENELAQKYGIQSIPATFLLDGEGKIIGKDLRGRELEEAVAKALKSK